MTAAALMVYGLGGTRYDFGDLPRQLQAAGITPHMVTLAGHETEPTALKQVAAEAWQAQVAQHYAALQQQFDTVHLVGICMGALLACDLAAKLPAANLKTDNGRLVLLSMPLYLDGWDTPWYSWMRGLHHVVPALRRWIRVREDNTFGIKNVRLRAIVKKRFERGEGFHYGWIPLQSVWQLDRLRTWVRASLTNVTRTTLLIHAKEDEITSTRSAQTAIATMPAQQTSYIELDNSYHMICIDNDKALVAKSVMRFLGGENPTV